MPLFYYDGDKFSFTIRIDQILRDLIDFLAESRDLIGHCRSRGRSITSNFNRVAQAWGGVGMWGQGEMK